MDPAHLQEMQVNYFTIASIGIGLSDNMAVLAADFLLLLT